MEFDSRAKDLGVYVTETFNATWDLTVLKYQNDQESGGNHHIYFTVLDATSKPKANVTCVVDWVGRDDPQPFRTMTDANGQANFPMYANLDITLKNGPYFAYIENESKSDVARGMGLPEHHHVNFLITFAPPAATPPPVTPPPSTTLEQIVQSEAKKYKWMPINDQAALYEFAQKNNLGYPQTDEFEFTIGAITYVGQVYNLGIVYVKKGDWGNCQWTKKP